jgi:hypothetical protein
MPSQQSKNDWSLLGPFQPKPTPAHLQDKLRETLRDEHSFLVQFMLTVWRRCLTPFQAATLHIQVLAPVRSAPAGITARAYTSACSG